MVAGGTGLAPLRAVVEQLDRRWAERGRAPRVHLFHGARVPWNLYEHRLLSELAARPWFDYTPVVSEDASYPGRRGLVGSAAAGAAPSGGTAVVCGSTPMVRHTVAELTGAGLPTDRIRYERCDTLEMAGDSQ